MAEPDPTRNPGAVRPLPTAAALERSADRLGLHHIAYLRALCEGLDVEAAAARYLHVDHARAARRAHRAVVERVRALARRRGDPAWRLIGITIRAPGAHAGTGSTPAQAGGRSAAGGRKLPSLAAWAEEHGLEDLRESELQDLYVESFGLAGPNTAAATSAEEAGPRRHQRAERLRRRQFEVLRALEAAVAQPAQPDDPVDSWLPPALAEQLVAAGVATLAALAQRIDRGGRWWRGLLHAYGPTKAQRLAQHVALLMGRPPSAEVSVGGLDGDVAAGGRPDLGPVAVLPSTAGQAVDGSAPPSGLTPTSAVVWLPQPAVAGMPSPAAPCDRATLARVARLLFDPAAPGSADLPAWVLGRCQVPPGAPGEARRHDGEPGAVARLAATDDRAAVREWIAARAGSGTTATRYQREAERWMLWLVTQRGHALSAATALDCRLYMDHLADLPDDWISRHKAARWAPGWAPFKGSLTAASQAYAVHVLHGLYEWLVRAGYLSGNPWTLVNRKLPATAQPRQAALGPASRAFTPQAWAALNAHLQARPPGPAKARLRWLCTFAEATGLRAAELLAAKLGDLQNTGPGWLIVVVGKGGKGRVVPVPQVAIQATREYLASRGMALTTAAPATPLLGSLQAPAAPITYGALYQSFTLFVRQALAAGTLTPAEREQAAGAALHWLRHTHATRAAERGVPPDVVQAGLGHADPRMTAAYYRAQIERRQREMEKAFGPTDPQAQAPGRPGKDAHRD